MMVASLLLLLLTADAPEQGSGQDAGARSQAGEVTPSTDAPKSPHHFDALGVPLLTFNSDTGVGIGAVGGAYFYAPGHEPYQHAISAQVFFTTFGVQGHYLSYDGPRLIGPLRVEAHLEFHRELYTPFYGPGNNSSPGALLELDERRLGYLGSSMVLWSRLRLRPFGEDNPFQIYAGYSYNWNKVTPYAGSVLEMMPPVGFHGGRSPYVMGGMLYDSRDNETDATQGFYAELALRVARQSTHSQFDYQGLSANVRKFFPLFTPRIVFALNGAADHLWGNVPFWEWTSFGGISHFDGIGGQGTVRGVPRERYQGDSKFFANAELRFYPIEFPALGATIKVGGDLFFDTGRVWHPDTDAGNLFSPAQWHSGVGGGLRLGRRAAVIRGDYGYELGTGRKALYITFGQLF